MVLFKERTFQVASLVFILVVWEIMARLVGLGDTYPPPSRVAPDFIDLFRDGDVWGPLLGTLQRTFSGFLVAFIVSIAYGILTHVSPRFDAYTRGLVGISLFAPTLIVIFLGMVMIGRTFAAVVAVVSICIFAEIATYMRDAFRNFDDELVSMSRSYKVATRQRVSHMYLPFLVPPMLATSRIGFALAWKITFLCEVFGFPEGVGWEVRSSYRVYDMPMLLAWLAVFIVTLLVIEQCVRALERGVVKW